MLLLILFGFLAGAGTALSPCVLPVLPIVLSAGATGGRRRPLGIVIGLTASFTFATVALVYVLSALGLPDTLLRTLAIAVLLGFGVVLLVPPLAARVEARLSRFAGRLGAGRAAGRRGEGFGSGLLVGASLGLVYAPCAGPVLAGVITVSAAQPFTAGRLAVAFAYGVGSAIVLYALMLGGRRLTAPLARRSGRLQMAMGAVMVLVAFAMLQDWDLRFQSTLAKELPAIVVNPTGGLERSAATRDALARVRGRREDGGGVAAAVQAAQERPLPPDDVGDAAGSDAASARPKLPVIAPAPEFAGTQRWFNTPGDRPLTLMGLRGRVVLIDFWTYSCINCIRTLPYLTAWDRRYRRDGLTIVGVHTPEFPFEKDAGNVAAALAREGIRYPVAQDNERGTWDAWSNDYWPAEYFVDARGRVRFAHFGEGAYEEKEQVIRTLLAEAGADVAARRAGGSGTSAAFGVTTPESYLGAARADRFANGAIFPGPRDYGAPPRPGEDQLAYGGSWDLEQDHATAGADGTLDLAFGARRVFLVLGSPGGRARSVRVLLDGRPLPTRFAGRDVFGGVATVDEQRLYDLVDLPAVGRHRLRIVPDPGVEAYAFTFG